MSVFSEAAGFSRLAWDLKAFLRQRLSPDAARATLRSRLARRDANFLEMVDRRIVAVPASPYRPLLALAGCEPGDLEHLVRTRGLEATLRQLRAEGVYVTFDEFKGRAPMVRRGREIPLAPGAFRNPLARHYYWTKTGGTTGTGTRVSTDLARLADLAPYILVAHEAYGLADVPKAIWRGMLPAGAAINSLLASAVTGDFPRRWFTPLAAGDLTSSRKYPLATYAIIALSRLNGVPLPWPEHVSPDRADVVARWAADAAASHGRCHVSTSASMALRVCEAARAHGLDLTGTTFSGGGEPMTDAKAAGIARAGADCRPTYFSTETGAIGMSCVSPVDPNDQHLLSDSVALVQHPHPVPGVAAAVDAFNVTTLLPSSSHVMLNVELDDYGVVERRTCGCAFEALGFTEHVRHIRSFRKLTGEGVTLVGSDMERILEQVLPATFGGSPLDYQLSEEEDATGFTRLALVVSPRVAIRSEADVVKVVLAELGRSGAGSDHARATWQHAGTLQVRRTEPVWTDRGKLLPLHFSSRRRPEGDTSQQGRDDRAGRPS